ncbi:sulfite exporter TauE/SafE family protein [Thermococcus celer]|uniref:Probable membrane transporter protein n=1 Tax=Thermococcus celer Vu 13 = JCM 8558 TaxID=1293037 RepID=A0A218P0N1_THECE|nr:sulfite exporter TauE/SafE family protein [Thermococcus celer]ASI98481.1 permease [Thermococcus celer] [Thermococcus celer Vu 13 = JCM 8558]
MDYVLIAFIAFILSVIFSIGGVGSAIAIVPTMTWLGISLMVAKPTGLFINTLSMLSATLKNLREKKLDHRFGLPILIAATVSAPIGAYTGKFVPKRYVLGVFIAFLLYSGTMMIFFKPRPRGKDGNHIVEGSMIGALAGFLGGLLGVGGGGIISPTLIMLGYEPKKVATTTALVVFFSSLSGFLTYWGMGTLDWKLLGVVSVSAIAGGWLGTHLMHFKMSSDAVKKVIGVILYLMMIRMIAGIL